MVVNFITYLEVEILRGPGGNTVSTGEPGDNHPAAKSQVRMSLFHFLVLFIGIGGVKSLKFLGSHHEHDHLKVTVDWVSPRT